ncbi:MAG: hypothetical protein R3E50_05830 [Halioglobus sp.]
MGGRCGRRPKLDLADIFIEAAVQRSLPYNADFNGPSQGRRYYQTNIRRGRRPGSARTFLRACGDRPNLTRHRRPV